MHRARLLLFCSVGTLVYKYSYLIGKIPFPEQEKSRDFPAEYTFFTWGHPRLSANRLAVWQIPVAVSPELD